ncbi:MAG: hypothetical protein N2Z85_03025 [Patescibacteria group bacterium]|nr:hypothetical protein [Patescibacteria group bacterium]
MNENIDFKKEDLNKKFLEFKKEIAQIREEEISGVRKTADLIDSSIGNFNVDDLTYEDMEIFEKVKNKTIKPKDLEEYRKKMKKISDERRLKGQTTLSSREIFLGFIINMSSAMFYEKALEEINKKNLK